MKRSLAWLMTLLCFVTPAAALAQDSSRYHGPHMWGDGWHGWLFGPIMMILFIAVTVVVVLLLVRWLGGPGHGPATHGVHGRTPLDILKERVAKGEIDKDEYQERRRMLES